MTKTLNNTLLTKAIGLSLLSLASPFTLAEEAGQHMSNLNQSLSDPDHITVSSGTDMSQAGLGTGLANVNSAQFPETTSKDQGGVIQFSSKDVNVSTSKDLGNINVNVNNGGLAGDNSQVTAIVNINIYSHGGGGVSASGGGTAYFQGGVLTNDVNGLVSILPADCGEYAGTGSCLQVVRTESTQPLTEGGNDDSTGGTGTDQGTTVIGDESSDQGAMPSFPVQPAVPVTVVVPPTPLTGTGTTPATSETPSQQGAVLQGTFRAEGKTFTDLRITSQGSLSEAVLMGRTINQGWVSNSTVGAGAVFEGGVLTGVTTNQGTISNVDFRGSSIKGGKLAGTINNSRGGTIEDVTLSADARVTGGELAGTIVGDCANPATLEDLTISEGSNVSCATLGDNVSVEAGAKVTESEGESTPPDTTEPVTTDEDTTTPTSTDTGEEPTSTTPAATETTGEETPVTVRSASETVVEPMPSLGEGLAVNNEGDEISTATTFAGGSAVNGAETFQQQASVAKLKETVNVKANISVDPEDMGQAADIFVYADYQATAGGDVFQLMLDENGSYLLWDGEVANLEPFQSQVALQESQLIDIYEGLLLEAGILKVSVGYRLKDGKVVLSSDVLQLTVTD